MEQLPAAGHWAECWRQVCGLARWCVATSPFRVAVADIWTALSCIPLQHVGSLHCLIWYSGTDFAADFATFPVASWCMVTFALAVIGLFDFGCCLFFCCRRIQHLRPHHRKLCLSSLHSEWHWHHANSQPLLGSISSAVGKLCRRHWKVGMPALVAGRWAGGLMVSSGMGLFGSFGHAHPGYLYCCDYLSS